jgi:hypothetical protein
MSAIKRRAKRVTRHDVWEGFVRIEEGFARLQQAQEEARKAIKESEERNEKARQESEERNKKARQEYEERNEKSMQELRKMIGRLGNRFGEFAEHTLVPNLTEKFKEYDFTFSKIGENIKLDDKEQGIHAEIDAFLENGIEAMVVEVKVHLETGDVKDHLKRMEKVRKYADLRGDHRRFYGAIAASVIDEDVKSYALKQGFFVVEPSGEDVKVTAPFSKAASW